ncbi:RelA/SpoT family protein [Polynucleobacter asymbioticus]|jgi:GTP pyrophosphokinase|uniref:GTP pyrophosphokinase n=2 Tax=Polynucleobacter asymbioticus TaxID=576611 RepID=A4SX32_POLAQ|nr:HD domain-containing protein [Polynucleobacter asymbioticus]ABP34046.1 (p)ppGpp synthetase I, SpoT/RelA [Polynucleobacter asymbioticus QLW-P1DMWA-1]APB98701.1 GTP pyrophosphokinase [Polynucleobacter asymbioticus]APC00987.1 GTP pyrophosphokinase [Polynucleobacter asymbioticus]APC05902.1 GTP pyrophosphokinase [Polynucleobacter asymbioticus]
MANTPSQSDKTAIFKDAWFGEPAESHAAAVTKILQSLNLDEATLIAASNIARTHGKEALTKLIGDEPAKLLIGYRGLRQAQAKLVRDDGGLSVSGQEEMLRKMLLAFGDDLRVVLIYLASRLETLRWVTQEKMAMSVTWAQEILNIDASLANRLGIWQMKWEMEDLAFRALSPETYREIANMLDAKRIERQAFIERIVVQLQEEIKTARIDGEVLGRPKHIYSIWKKMQGKSLDFANLYDVRAFRVLVEDVKTCYAVLGIVHNIWQPVPREFDDYIARPKPNGYQSLHTVVMNEDGAAFEIQIRTHEMHQQAEYGLAAHWRYKEGAYTGMATPANPAKTNKPNVSHQQGTHSAEVAYERQIAWARQLISWKEDAWEQLKHHEIDDHIYVLTPLGKVISLEKGSTPIDFAYAVHTNLGHRCRGARVDGAMVPLETALQNGQTVEIIAVKHGGPSRDWISPDKNYLRSQRARQRVRAWFNALDDEEGGLVAKTSDKTDISAEQKPTPSAPEIVLRNSSRKIGQGGDVLVVGVDSLLTQLARCCRPVPPDAIGGFVTQGRGVSIHRRSCKTFRGLLERAPERVIQTAWTASAADPVVNSEQKRVFPADLVVSGVDRPELMRELFEILTRQGVHVIDLRKSAKKGLAQILLTVEIKDSEVLRVVQNSLEEVKGVTQVRRR